MSTTEAAAAVASAFKIQPYHVVIWVLGAAVIAFCIWKFIKTKKELNEKRKNAPEQTQKDIDPEDDNY